MSSLFETRWRELNLLDAGAGAGALSAALVRRICATPQKPRRISITAYELDPELIGELRGTLDECARCCETARVVFSAFVHNTDFITAAAPMVRDELFAPALQQFNAAIVNPPYRKIRSDSATRSVLRSAGIEASNLYAGFLALIVKLLGEGGELVAITPRSFCNGPYFKSFRLDFLEAMALRRLHVFESRSAAFSRDDVLQENVIAHAVKSRSKPEQVVVSTSSGKAGGDVTERKVLYCEVVSPDDQDCFIHLVADERQARVKTVMSRLSTKLVDLGLSVSTGRVVDFRAKEFLRPQPEDGTVPLIYPCHFNGGFVHWPKEKSRKPNAIICDAKTRDLLVPAGVYVLVKRFTAKEERRRVAACIYDPKRIRAAFIGFENHLNYFHAQGKGLPMNLAKGLAAFLNSTLVDVFFRQFNGHTQVNATDLRSLNYPTMEQLERLGRMTAGTDQSTLDQIVERELNARK